MDITQSFDGDGQILKRYEVDTIYQEGQPPYTESSTVYQLRSRALGGKLLTEIGAQGQKLRTYVYANGGLLAWQQVYYFNGNVDYQAPVWEHRDVSNASYRTTGTTYPDPESAAELDPFNSNMGFENPYHFPPDPPLPHKPNIFYPGFGWGSNQACRVSGVDTPCNEAMQVVNNHAGTVELARQGPDGRFPPLDLGKRAEFIGDYLIVGHSNWTQDGNNYYYQGMNFVGVILPQNTGPNVDDLQNRIGRMVSDPGCAKFISDLINGTATAKNPAEFTNALTGFGMNKAQGGFIYGDTVRKAYGFDGATVHGSISGKSAQVELPFPIPFRSFGPVNQRAAAAYGESQARIQAGNTLHEILHLAGKNGYDDFAYANTVASMREVKPPDYSGLAYRDAVRKASEFWGHALGAACKPR